MWVCVFDSFLCLSSAGAMGFVRVFLFDLVKLIFGISVWESGCFGNFYFLVVVNFFLG